MHDTRRTLILVFVLGLVLVPYFYISRVGAIFAVAEAYGARMDWEAARADMLYYGGWVLAFEALAVTMIIIMVGSQARDAAMAQTPASVHTTVVLGACNHKPSPPERSEQNLLASLLAGVAFGGLVALLLRRSQR